MPGIWQKQLIITSTIIIVDIDDWGSYLLRVPNTNADAESIAAMRARAGFLKSSIEAAEGPTRWVRDPQVVAYAAGRVDAWRAEFEDLCERLRFVRS